MLDPLTEQFKLTQPVFYTLYRNARTIVDNPGGPGEEEEPEPEPPVNP